MSGLKLFHASDLHFGTGYFDYILALQDKFDIFCFSGDFLYKESAQEKEQTSLWLKSFKKPVFICSGNHDMPSSWLNSINGIYSDGAIKTINGVKFGCVPYLCDDLLEFAECDILLTHEHQQKGQRSWRYRACKAYKKQPFKCKNHPLWAYPRAKISHGRFKRS